MRSPRRARASRAPLPPLPPVAVLAVLAVLAAAGAPRGAGAQDGGRHAAVVLELPASARAAALGGAYAAVGGDDAALFYDPAQLATISRGIGLSVERYLASSTVAALSAGTRIGRTGRSGAIAFGVQSIRYDGIAETVASQETGRSLSAADVVVSAGYGVEVRPLRLPGGGAPRVGVAAKYARQQVAEVTGGALAADVALAAPLPRGAVLAVVAQNHGGALALAGRARPLPRRLGVAGALPLAPSSRVGLLATAELFRVADEGTRAAGGVEARWRPGAAGGGRGLALDLRVGARQRTHGAAASPVTVGGGVAAGRFALDYAYQDYTVLGTTHRLGVRWAR